MTVRERFNKMIESKAFYIIFSVLASVTIWLYVAYVNNPDVTMTVSDIKITFAGQQTLAGRNLVITKTDADILTLKLLGSRNTVSQLSNTNVTATVDLSGIKAAGVYELSYTMGYPAGIKPSAIAIAARSVDRITITVDAIDKKDVPVHATPSSAMADGYEVGTTVVTPSTITISGPKADIDRVSYASADLSDADLTKTVDGDFPLTLMDDGGNAVESSFITLSQKTAHVRIPVVITKTVPLTVTLTFGAGADDSNTTFSVSPASVTLSGDTETLGGLTALNLGTIDTTSFLTSSTQTLTLALPDGTTNVSGFTQAQVTVTVSGLETKHVTASSFETSNVPSGMTAVVTTKSLDVVLRGKADDLSKVTAADLRVTADLSSVGTVPGTYTVPVTVTLNGGASTGIIGTYKITVKIAKA
ncbi:CdaR family protein [Oscillospiraceae bacterium WX1]